jgi:O-succinylbenzoate synthase
MITIQRFVLRDVEMPLKSPFATSFGVTTVKRFLLVEAHLDNGKIGYGETTTMEGPFYNEETLETARHILQDYLVPIALSKEWSHPDEITDAFEPIRGNQMAKASIEGAIWDAYAKSLDIPLAEALGGTKKQIEVGVSIGIQPSTKDLIHLIEGFVSEGYRRMKIKIKPGWDVDVLREVRRQFPDVAMMADANSAYTLNDIPLLKQLDEFGLTMIEQPLSHDDIFDHAKLQKELLTPICLDESIHTLDHARHAIELEACRIINIKVGRVGGLTPARRMHDLCAAHGIPVWCGGMLESGVGRAHNVAITTLSNYTMPGDTSSSNRYWHEDIIEPEVVAEQGFIQVPDRPGIGYEVDQEKLERYTSRTLTRRR